jgi:hypothetical protein
MAIRLTLGSLTLLALAQPAASFAQIPLTQQSQSQIGVPAPAPSPRGGAVLEMPQKRSSLRADAELSRRASEYLHHHRLPYVDAQVQVDDAGIAKSVVLTGQVRTDFGKQDAERKVRASLDDPNVVIRNQIEVNTAIASRPMVHQGVNNELNLNPVFLACWRGTAPRPDTFKWIGGCPQPHFVAKTMELCLRKDGDSGLAVTFQNLSAPLANFRDHTELVSSDGRNHIDLLSVGGFISGNAFSLDHATYSTSWQCDLSESDRVLTCRGSSSNDCNGKTWARYTMHIDLTHVR